MQLVFFKFVFKFLNSNLFVLFFNIHFACTLHPSAFFFSPPSTNQSMRRTAPPTIIKHTSDCLINYSSFPSIPHSHLSPLLFSPSVLHSLPIHNLVRILQSLPHHPTSLCIRIRIHLLSVMSLPPLINPASRLPTVCATTPTTTTITITITAVPSPPHCPPLSPHQVSLLITCHLGLRCPCPH